MGEGSVEPLYGAPDFCDCLDLLFSLYDTEMLIALTLEVNLKSVTNLNLSYVKPPISLFSEHNNTQAPNSKLISGI